MVPLAKRATPSLRAGGSCASGPILIQYAQPSAGTSAIHATGRVLAFYLMALTWQETLKDILINSPSLADTYAQAGRFAESLEAAHRMTEVAPDYANSYVYQARALHLLGRRSEAEAVMAGARARFGEEAITEYEEAMLAMAQGDATRTLECLERHALRRANGAHCMAVDPTFGALRRDRRWHAMLKRVGLPDFESATDHAKQRA